VTACARECRFFRRHLDSCPVEDRKSSAWVSAMVSEDERDMLCNADARPMVRDLAALVHVGRYGGLEVRHECRGCLPRPAEHGSLCEQCHIRLTGWLDGATRIETRIPRPGDPRFWEATSLRKFRWTPDRGVLEWYTTSVTERRWVPSEASIAWAYDWLAADREPRQAATGLDKIMQGKKVPPAALNLHATVLRDDICIALGRWLRWLAEEYNLHGPDWWRFRVDRRRYEASSWRSWRPQTQREVTDAQKYLAGWLDRIEGSPDLAAGMYRDAEDLMVRVASLAPWRAEPKRLPDIECPSCDRAALALYSGDEHLTCGRCGEIVKRATYDRWAYLIEAEKAG
jgi:5-methylcytosine-specific restriction endonuclease McrA